MLYWFQFARLYRPTLALRTHAAYGRTTDESSSGEVNRNFRLTRRSWDGRAGIGGGNGEGGDSNESDSVGDKSLYANSASSLHQYSLRAKNVRGGTPLSDSISESFSQSQVQEAESGWQQLAEQTLRADGAGGDTVVTGDDSNGDDNSSGGDEDDERSLLDSSDDGIGEETSVADITEALDCIGDVSFGTTADAGLLSHRANIRFIIQDLSISEYPPVHAQRFLPKVSHLPLRAGSLIRIYFQYLYDPPPETLVPSVQLPKAQLR